MRPCDAKPHAQDCRQNTKDSAESEGVVGAVVGGAEGVDRRE